MSKVVAIYTDIDGEVIVFPVVDGLPVGTKEYFFDNSGRDIEDYDIELVELPLVIRSTLRTRASKVL